MTRVDYTAYNARILTVKAPYTRTEIQNHIKRWRIISGGLMPEWVKIHRDGEKPVYKSIVAFLLQ